MIIGVRHHSPVCARLVAARIAALRPAHVLIEGPADFNDRIDELHLGHDLPVAIHTYLATPEVHHASWTPLAEHSPEWQALVTGRASGAQVRFIDLPSWHPAFADLENRYADAADAEEEARATAYSKAVGEQLGIDNSDALWDHLFESQVGGDLVELERTLQQWFVGLRGDTAGSEGNVARETMMARWISWAMGTGDGPVLVVCGGYHAPRLARLWRETDPAPAPPPVPAPDEHHDGADPGEVRSGSFLVPYSFRRLDAFTGYASGMPSPAYHQWVWESGPEAAGTHLLEQVRNRLRLRRLPVSTATLVAVHTHAHGLARLRGHRVPLRTDWLDAMAAGWVNDALEVPVPWSYRGTIRPRTDPVLVEVMDVSSGEQVGRLAPGTPQPPLVASVADELSTAGLPPTGTVTLDLLDAAVPLGEHGPTSRDRQRSRILHRLQMLDIPGVQRISGPGRALGSTTGSSGTSGTDHRERWRLSDPPHRLAALIEAGAWGGTLLEAARARWEAGLPALAGDVAGLADALDRAVWAGLTSFADRVVDQLAAAVGSAQDLGALGLALRALLPLARNPELVGLGPMSVVAATVDAIVDRTLWLLEPAARVEASEVDRHLGMVIGLRDVVRTVRTHPGTGLGTRDDRVVAVLARKAADTAGDPASRGAALGALVSLDEPLGQHPLALLAGLSATHLGDALAGLIALARQELLTDSGFVAGLDRTVTSLDGHAFVGALPALRGAFAWLPPRERGELARRVLAHHGHEGLSARTLTARTPFDPVAIATATRTEADLVSTLRTWGAWPAEDATATREGTA